MTEEQKTTANFLLAMAAKDAQIEIYSKALTGRDVEIEQLRAALREIAGMTGGFYDQEWCDVANKALHEVA